MQVREARWRGGSLSGCGGRSARFAGAMLRILSDLHLFDARTQLRELAQLEPLLGGVRTLVLNGDTCEMRCDFAPEQLEPLRAFLAARVPEVVFVTGNHDPDISDVHEYLGADGRVWVTHGDVCFDDFTPWSHHVAQLRREIAAQLAREPHADFRRLDVRLRIARHVARTEADVADLATGGWRSQARWVWQTFFPPRQVLAMLRCWRELPRRAAAFARAQRPTAQVVVTGHVHFPGVWPVPGGPVVINTGSFLRPLGGNLVDIAGEHVVVRRIERGRGGFGAGKLLAQIPLTRASAPAR